MRVEVIDSLLMRTDQVDQSQRKLDSLYENLTFSTYTDWISSHPNDSNKRHLSARYVEAIICTDLIMSPWCLDMCWREKLQVIRKHYEW